MTLVRQVWLLVAVSLLIALGGGVGVAVLSARDALQTQVRIKNSDNAAALALAATQQKGDAVAIELLLSAQFDTGFYREILWTGPDDRLVFERTAAARAAEAPDWFVRALPIAAEPGIAQLSDGWRPLGTVRVATQTAYVHDDLWHAALRAAAVLGALGVLSGALATWVVRRIGRAMDAGVEQAQALLDGRFVTVPEPDIPELQRFTSAMNAMVGRLKRVFEVQAKQVDDIRRQATCDPLTGVANRAHFLAQLQGDLQRDDGPAQVSLVLLRLGDLASLNHVVGHARTDRLIRAVADTLADYAENVRGSLLGRLNGSDFAVSLPVGGVAEESGLAIAQALQVVVPTLAPGASVAVGVVEIDRATAAEGLHRVLGLADAALARAEAGEPFAVRVVDTGPRELDSFAARGEGAWRAHLMAALSDPERVRLAHFPVVDREGRLLHLECPLRLQLEADGPFEPAATWLPLALRSRATARADERAVALALAAIDGDGTERCVNLSHASLADPGFVARLHARIVDRPRAARRLWLELPESVAIDQFARLQHVARELRPLGVRLGLEHAGNRLHDVGALYEAGLDYVKLDPAMGADLPGSDQRIGFVRALVVLLHGLAIQVLVEGVRSREDVELLWGCGVDGVTGPWVPASDPGAPVART